MELNIGNIIYRSYANKITDRLVVERVTKTKAVAGSYEFKRNCNDNGFVYEKKLRRYSSCTYRVETNELKEKYKRIVLIEKINTIKLDKLKTEQLEEIVKDYL